MNLMDRESALSELDRANLNGVKVLGIDSFAMDGGNFTPIMDLIADFSDSDQESSIEMARKFIRNNITDHILVEITFENISS